MMAGLTAQDYELLIRQQPKTGCVAITKGKDRRPLDPPPIVQLKVSQRQDPTQRFLQNPYLILVAKLIPKAGEIEEQQRRAEVKGGDLAGTVVSSLYNLKDTNNSQGGFFVFGDLSVKKEGVFRLEFILFEIKSQTKDCWQLSSCISDPFQVYANKAFPGLQESTFLTRTFSDQGVRLRLRKDSRTVVQSRKRGASGAPQTDLKSQSMGFMHDGNHDLSPNGQQHHGRRTSTLDYESGSYDFGYDTRAPKRMRHSSSAGDHPGYDNGYYTHNPNPRTMPEPLVSATFSSAIPMTTSYPVHTEPAISGIAMRPSMATFPSLHPLNTQISPQSAGPNSASSTFSPGTRRSPLSAYQFSAAHHGIYASPTHLSYPPTSTQPSMTQHGDLGMELPGIGLGDMDK
ncbi:velvet factor-domain-containing protein [Triangularia verruculosa]|uniref:Velvet factor-domain-containing protein n=1 Tax=Triangularia verruculosa TaxID=2587418 RepID=A0AAN6XLT0_9PEZI|nr:velvet factor-domain-containing protein [Triangularia verruculosa]